MKRLTATTIALCALLWCSGPTTCSASEAWQSASEIVPSVDDVSATFKRKWGLYRVDEYWQLVNELFESDKTVGGSGVLFLRFHPKHEMTTDKLIEIFGYPELTSELGDTQAWQYDLGTREGEKHFAVVRVADGEVKDTLYLRSHVDDPGIQVTTTRANKRLNRSARS